MVESDGEGNKQDGATLIEQQQSNKVVRFATLSSSIRLNLQIDSDEVVVWIFAASKHQ